MKLVILGVNVFSDYQALLKAAQAGVELAKRRVETFEENFNAIDKLQRL